MMAVSALISDARSRRESYRLAADMAVKKVGARNAAIEAFTDLGGAGKSSSPFLGYSQINTAARQYQHYKDIPYTAIRPVACKIAGLPIHVGMARKRKEGAGGDKAGFQTKEGRAGGMPDWLKSATSESIEPLDNHSFLDDISDPNPLMTAWASMYCTVVSLYMTGLAHWWMAPDPDDGGTQFWYLPTTWVNPLPTDDSPFGEFKVRPPWYAGEGWTVPASDMVRFTVPDPANPLSIFAPLQSQAMAVDVDDMVQRAQHTSMRDGPRPQVVLTAGRLPDMPGMPGTGMRPVLTPEQRKQLVAAIKMAYAGPTKYGEPFIIDGLIENITPFGRTPAEMDFLGSSRLTKSRIMQGLGVNPIVAGEIEGANRASAVVADSYFYALVVNPLAVQMSQVMTNSIGPRYASGKGGKKGEKEGNGKAGSDEKLVIWIAPAEAEDPALTLARVGIAVKVPGCMTKGELRRYVSTGVLKIEQKEDDDEPVAPPLPAGGPFGGGGEAGVEGAAGGGQPAGAGKPANEPPDKEGKQPPEKQPKSVKHLPGQHDQMTHGHGGGSGGTSSNPGRSSGLSDEQVYDELLNLGVHEDYIDEMTPAERRRRLDQGHRESDEDTLETQSEGTNTKPKTSERRDESKQGRKPNREMASGVPDDKIMEWAVGQFGQSAKRDFTADELRFIYAQRVLGEKRLSEKSFDINISRTLTGQFADGGRTIAAEEILERVKRSPQNAAAGPPDGVTWEKWAELQGISGDFREWNLPTFSLWELVKGGTLAVRTGMSEATVADKFSSGKRNPAIIVRTVSGNPPLAVVDGNHSLAASMRKWAVNPEVDGRDDVVKCIISDVAATWMGLDLQKGGQDPGAHGKAVSDVVAGLGVPGSPFDEWWIGGRERVDVKHLPGQHDQLTHGHGHGGSATETPEFKAWFGESKVVDENGKPLRVYHGTSAMPFSQFQDDEKTSFGTVERFHFFDPDPEYPGQIGNRVLPVYLSIQNPLISDSISGYDLAMGTFPKSDFTSKGYDGIKTKEGWWVAFSPTQIKSATGNRGTFDPNDPDITKAIAPLTTKHLPGRHDQLDHGRRGGVAAASRSQPSTADRSDTTDSFAMADDPSTRPPTPSMLAPATRDIPSSSVLSDETARDGLNITSFVEVKEGEGDSTTTTKYAFKPADGESPYTLDQFRGRQCMCEVAASVVDDAMGLGLVAKTEMATLDGVKGSLQEYINDTAKTASELYGDPDPDDKTAVEAANERLRSVAGIDDMLYYDALIGNDDRHLKNWMVKDGQAKLIDNGRSFARNDQYDDFDRSWLRTMEHDPDYRAVRPMSEKFKSGLAGLLSEREAVDARLKAVGLEEENRAAFWKRAEHLRKIADGEEMLIFSQITLMEVARMAEGRKLF